MKRIIFTICLSTIMLAGLYISPILFEYEYAKWQLNIMKNLYTRYLIIFILSIILLVLGFSSSNGIGKENRLKYFGLSLIHVYMILNIIFFPAIKVFGGSKIQLLIMVLGFAPNLSIMAWLLFKEIKK